MTIMNTPSCVAAPSNTIPVKTRFQFTVSITRENTPSILPLEVSSVQVETYYAHLNILRNRWSKLSLLQHHSRSAPTSKDYIDNVFVPGSMVKPHHGAIQTTVCRSQTDVIFHDQAVSEVRYKQKYLVSQSHCNHNAYIWESDLATNDVT